MTSLDLPGSGQMQYVRNLIESRPYFSRTPDQSLLTTSPPDGAEHMQATRGEGLRLYLFSPGKTRPDRDGKGCEGSDSGLVV
jgi:hypothetical protein